MSKDTKQQELTTMDAFNEKMYRLGFEDAENKRGFGESLRQESTTYEYQGQKVEQLTLF